MHNRPAYLALMASTAIALSLIATGAGAQLATTETGEATLDPITVEGSSYETEGTDSYTTDHVSVGEKAAMRVRDVPQSVSVVTRKQIEDAGYTALETALDDVAGLLILNNDTGRSSIYSRGYEFDYLYLDGLAAPVSSIYGTQPDLAVVDHVEVLKGPAGLFTGTGEPAGAINMRLKQATATETTGYVTTTVDSNGAARIEGDISGRLNRSGTLRGRAVLAYGDGDGYVDQETNGVKLGYGTLAWDLTPETTLTVSASQTDRDIAPFNGLPTYADGSLIWTDASATTAADWNEFDNSVKDYTAALDHRLENGGSLKFSLRKSHQEANFLYAYAGSTANANNEVSKLAWLARDFEQDSLALDAHAELPFYLGTWAGTAVLGADWQHVTSTTLTGRGSISGTFDLDDWDTSGVAKPDVAYTSAQQQTNVISKGIYSQFRLKPTESLSLIGGARLSWYKGITTNLLTDTSDTVTEKSHLTPFAGLTWDVSPQATLYASYSEIFIPQSYVDKNGKTLDPVEGQQYELGVKAQMASGLNLSAALFQLEEVNRPEAVDGEDYYAAEEAVRSRGVEFEASGELRPNLHLAGGYTWTDTEYTKGESSGETFSTVTPEHMLKLSVAWEATEGMLEGWSFGGRFRGVTGFSSNGIEAPGYGIVDLSTAKDLGHDTTLRLGVDNVFDKDYYTRVGSTTVFNFRGAPRTFTAAVTKRF